MGGILVVGIQAFYEEGLIKDMKELSSMELDRIEEIEKLNVGVTGTSCETALHTQFQPSS